MKILVIEDSSLYQKIHVKYMKQHLPEADFLTAGNGWEGYEKAVEEQPDVILLDLLMPVMDGMEFLKLFREKQGNAFTRIFVLSADVQHMVQEEALRLGAWRFIQKPLTEEKAGLIAAEIRGENHA